MRVRALGFDAPQENRELLMVVAELARARNILNQIARNSERRPLLEQIQIVTALLGVERSLSSFQR